MTQGSVPVGGHTDAAGAARTGAKPSNLHRPPGAPTPLRLTHPTATMITWGVIGLGYALIAGTFHRLTIPAELATLLPGAALLWYAQRPSTARFPAPDHLAGKATLAWGAVAAAFAIWEVYAALRGSTHAHPTLSILLGPEIDPPPARAAGYVAWLLAGVWVARR